MVAVTGSAIAIEWSALTAGSLSLSVSDHSSGSGEAEEGEEGESETGESLWKPTENKKNITTSMVVILEQNQLRNILIWLLNLEPEIQMILYRPYMRDMYIDMNHQPIQFLSEQRKEVKLSLFMYGMVVRMTL